MSCLGVHFALTDEQLSGLLQAPDDDARRMFMEQNIEVGEFPGEWAVETDKAWDAIHRALTGFPANVEYFTEENLPLYGNEVLRLCIMGGRQIYEGGDYIMMVIDADKVAGVSAALNAIDAAQFAERFRRHCIGAYPEYCEEEIEYYVHWFEGLKPFFARAAAAGRAVIFTADQ